MYCIICLGGLPWILKISPQDEDLLAKLGPLTSFVRLGLTFSTCQSCQLLPEDAAWVFGLCKTNMEVRALLLLLPGYTHGWSPKW